MSQILQRKREIESSFVTWKELVKQRPGPTGVLSNIRINIRAFFPNSSLLCWNNCVGYAINWFRELKKHKNTHSPERTVCSWNYSLSRTTRNKIETKSGSWGRKSHWTWWKMWRRKRLGRTGIKLIWSWLRLIIITGEDTAMVWSGELQESTERKEWNC